MKDKHTHGKKMARKGRTKVIYKGTFVSEQSLHVYFSTNEPEISNNFFMLPHFKSRILNLLKLSFQRFILNKKILKYLCHK